VPVSLMVIFTAILILYRDFGGFREHISWLCVGLVAAAYACVNMVLARETHGKAPMIVLQVLLSLVLAVIAWFSESLRLLTPFIVGAGILVLGNTVQWKKGRDDLHTWDFTHKIWTGAIFATVGSIIYLLGILAIMAALKSLFGIDIEKLMERILLPIGFGLLAPLYWLSTIPPVDEDASELYENPSFISKAVAFLGTWLLSPLTLIYALILLAYGLKIILTGELPKGEIAALTTPFLIIGTGTWLVLDPPFVRDNPLAKLFRKCWFFLSIPAALLLAVAIGIRIGNYGLTWERFGLVCCVVWALGLGLSFALGPKAKRDIRIIPGLAAALMFVTAFIAQPLSFHNQKSRAIDGLKTAGVMTEAGLIKPKADINIVDEAAARKAKGALQYLQKNNGFPAIQKMFEGAESIPDDDYKYSTDVVERLKLDSISLNSKDRDFYASYYNDDSPINISEYDLLSGPYWLNVNTQNSSSIEGKGTEFSIALGGRNVIIIHQGIEIVTYDIRTWVMAQSIETSEIIIRDPFIPIFAEGEQRLALVVKNISYSGNKEEFSVQVLLLSAGFE